MRNHTSFKSQGGLHVGRGGYINLQYRVGKRRKQIALHRVVMEQYLGRELRPNETVHHKNGNRRDNQLENLELWASRHPRGQRIVDLVAWAKGILFDYEPTALQTSYPSRLVA